VFNEAEISTRARMVKDVVDLVLFIDGLSVDKMYLIGSYANGRANEYSDIDYLVVLKGGKRPQTYPTWKQALEVKKKIDNIRIHVIYAVSLDAQKSLCQKDPVKYAYKEITDVNTLSPNT
jgi:predicted nucleotidyltransferase